MNSKPILIVAGEPNSIFLEIFFKSLKTQNFKKPLILIASLKLLKLQMKKLNFKKRIKLLDIDQLKTYKLNNLSINLINIEFNQNKAFNKISKKSNLYIEKSFKIAIKLLKNGYSDKLINGPISKKTFLNKEHLGITEYLTKKFLVNKSAMLIYNKELSVCPITTHLPLKLVTKNISKKIIIDKIKLINSFYKKKFSILPRIAVLGVNPHCESILKQNEDDMIIKPLIKKFTKLNFNVSGPHSADTIFLKKNRSKYDVIVGMYHDQVLAPIKTLFEYDAINITLGLPFIRISPDHGPNEAMIGKNISSPISLIKAIKFMEKN